ncbi:DUF3500 domain-containing protein [Flagellimonas iocasae]|uniref:DUF3500 domain-containing protein n=1 Tax=Flagellimonas iocasae TaxID=2055905 RepID=A0ABW4XRI7_9FLAO
MKTNNPLLYALLFLFSFQLHATDPVLDFLNSLNDAQLSKTRLQFDDVSRETWHYFPATMWPRTGIQLGELNEKQKELFQKMLQYHLSQAGYNKTMDIMSLENVLAEQTGDTFMRDKNKYHISVYGDPEKDKVWSWTFEGHHILLSFTVVGDKISYTPRFFGANPAIVQSGPRKGEHTLAMEENLGLDLINSLTPEQKAKAIFNEEAPFDIFTKNSVSVSAESPEGIPVPQLDKPQQEALLKLIHEYIAAVPDDIAKARMAKLESEELQNMYFAWAGATSLGKPHYYCIQGKTFLIEFDNSQNNANHIHSVWRDFDGDFGRDLIQEHYASHHNN